jgi:hypothetical protein
MEEAIIVVSMRRDAAHYLSMLLGDQLLSIKDSAIDIAMRSQLEPIRGAYEHVRETIEQALAKAPLGVNQSICLPDAVFQQP